MGLPESWTNPRDAGLSLITVTGFSPLGHEYNNPQSGTTNTVHVADTLTWTRGNHLLKSGFDARFIRQEAFRDVQARGSLTFTGQLHRQRRFRSVLRAADVHDARAGSTIRSGLRTESYAAFRPGQLSRPAEPDACPRGCGMTSPRRRSMPRIAPLFTIRRPACLCPSAQQVCRARATTTDRNNWAPRLGAAWTVDDAETTVVRGAYGLHYNHSALAPSEGLYFNAPYFNFAAYFTSPLGLVTLSDPFPSGLPDPDAESRARHSARSPNALPSRVQRDAAASTRRRRGSQKSRMWDPAAGTSSPPRDINQPRPSTAPLNLRPDPRFADITLIESRARSEFDSFQARFQQRYAFGCTMLVAYTLGKSMDDASGFFTSAGDPNFPQDSGNVDAEWGRSSFDVRHRFSVSFSYDLPLHFTVAGIVAMHSGRPFTAALLPEVDNSNTGRSSLGFGANDRPNVAGNPAAADPARISGSTPRRSRCPRSEASGMRGRNILDGPGYQNVNLALLKRFRCAAERRLQLRAEAFNLLNRANFDLPDNFFGSPTFGQVLSAGAPRHIQFGARLMF